MRSLRYLHPQSNLQFFVFSAEVGNQLLGVVNTWPQLALGSLARVRYFPHLAQSMNQDRRQHGPKQLDVEEISGRNKKKGKIIIGERQRKKRPTGKIVPFGYLVLADMSVAQIMRCVTFAGVYSLTSTKRSRRFSGSSIGLLIRNMLRSRAEYFLRNSFSIDFKQNFAYRKWLWITRAFSPQAVNSYSFFS